MVVLLRHFATVLGLIPSSRLSVASEACDMLYCCSDGVRGRGAPVTYLSHTASFHSNERIAPSNRGIKHLEFDSRQNGRSVTGYDFLLIITYELMLYLFETDNIECLDRRIKSIENTRKARKAELLSLSI